MDNQKDFQKGISVGYSYAIKSVTAYLNSGCHIKDCEFIDDWEPLMKALGREDEWNEFVEERKLKEQQNKEEECQQPQP